MKSRFLVIWVVLAAVICPAAATNYVYVSPQGSDDAGQGTEAEPFATISYSIGQADDGDVVVLLSGVYQGPGNTEFNMPAKTLRLQSVDPEDMEVVRQTIIDGDGAGHFLKITAGHTHLTIAGLTLRNACSDDPGQGAAVQVHANSSSIRFKNCLIKDNCRASMGGVLYTHGNATFENCIIIDNSAYSGAVAEVWDRVTTFKNCLLLNNTAAVEGGVVNCYYDGSAQILNSTAVGNSAPAGAVARLTDDGFVTVKNSILRENSPADAQICVGYNFGTSPSLSVSYSNIQGLQDAVRLDGAFADPQAVLTWGPGIIDDEPYFVDFDPEQDAGQWNLQLQSLYGRWDSQTGSWVNDPNTSSSIAAGDPETDIANEPWPHGNRINMGAFGGTALASKYGNVADFNVDGQVDYADLVLFLQAWLTIEPGQIYDIVGDGTVGQLDFSLFAENWLLQDEQDGNGQNGD